MCHAWCGKEQWHGLPPEALPAPHGRGPCSLWHLRPCFGVPAPNTVYFHALDSDAEWLLVLLVPPSHHLGCHALAKHLALFGAFSALGSSGDGSLLTPDYAEVQRLIMSPVHSSSAGIPWFNLVHKARWQQSARAKMASLSKPWAFQCVLRVPCRPGSHSPRVGRGVTSQLVPLPWAVEFRWVDSQSLGAGMVGTRKNVSWGSGNRAIPYGEQIGEPALGPVLWGSLRTVPYRPHWLPHVLCSNRSPLPHTAWYVPGPTHP